MGQFHTQTISSNPVTVGSNSSPTRKQWSKGSSTTTSTTQSWTQGDIFQDIVTGPNFHQVAVSTRGTVCAKGAVAARGAIQLLGQMSDTTLQKLEHCRSAEKPSQKTSEGGNHNQARNLISVHNGVSQHEVESQTGNCN